MSDVRFASYEAQHRTEYLRLLRRAWGEDALTEDEFDWWFDRNPAGSLRSVAILGDRVVGVAGHSFYRMVLGGEERLATFSVHATTHDSARGQGIFSALERKHEQEAAERGAAVTLAFASTSTAPIFLGPLGWSEIGRLRVWARPLLRAHEQGVNAPLEISGDAAASWPNHVIRDEAFLRWRYGESPRGYGLVSSPGGYAVVGGKRRRSRSVSAIVDLAVQAGSSRWLIQAALRRAPARVALALPGPPERRAFAVLGFVPVRYTLHFMGKSLNGRLDTDPAAWRFTLGDADFF